MSIEETEVFSPKDLKTLKQIFSWLDRDGKDIIKVQELGLAIRSFKDLTPSNMDIQDIVREINLSGKDDVNWQKYLAAIVKALDLKKISENDVVRAFRTFDKRQSGRISVHELRHLLTQTGEKMADEEAEAMISHADIDVDGNIVFSDYAKKLASFVGRIED